MRIDPQQWDEWRSRLELLKRQHPQLDWLWDVRIQVLRYFCSRYGRQLTEEQRRRTGMRLQREQLPSPSRSTIPIDQLPRIRSPEGLRSVLVDLHDARCTAESDIAARRGIMPGT